MSSLALCRCCSMFDEETLQGIVALVDLRVKADEPDAVRVTHRGHDAETDGPRVRRRGG